MKKPFCLGKTIIDNEALTKLHGLKIQAALRRHKSSKWKRLKRFRYVNDCVYSEHLSLNGTKFWVITRIPLRLTVVILPENYKEAVLLLKNKYGRR